MVEIGIDTPRGVKVPDVAWMSELRWSEQPADAEVTEIAPEICVEVLSRSNTRVEIDQKRERYFGQGALEFWTCEPDGRMHFFGSTGELSESTLVPAFPARIAG